MGRGKGSQRGSISERGEYIDGLNNVRQLIRRLETDVDKLKQSYFGSEDGGEHTYSAYVSLCSQRLAECHGKVAGKQATPRDVVDCEAKLLTLLNKARDKGVDSEAVDFVSRYCERLKSNMESAQEFKQRFADTCLKSLKSSCISYQDSVSYQDSIRRVGNKLTSAYAEDVKRYKASIVDTLKKLDQLLKCYTTGIKQDLFTSTNFTNRLFDGCDTRTFPIMRLIPDLVDKIVSVCSKARQWIDKDETYVHDITNVLREKRKETKKKEEDLRTHKERQNRLVQSLEETYSMLKDNKARLAKIEAELEALEEAVGRYHQDKELKIQEVREKEDMVGFLDIGISQTKKNYSLQIRRSRLLHQLRELEDNLNTIEGELGELENQIKEKRGERRELADKIRTTDATSTALKSDLEKFNKVVENLQKEVDELTDSMTHLEMIQSCKTSPEKVDDLYDHSHKVKLAPSLKEKITNRKKQLNKKR